MISPELDNDSLEFVCSLVRERSAIELDESKAYLINARLAPLAKAEGFDSTTELLQRLRTEKKPQLENSLVEAMTTNETSFFRDIHPFNALRDSLLPELVETKSTQRDLSVWSAACSTGQELYSTAILIKEVFPEVLSWKLELLGTDLSDEVLERARRGRYSQVEVNRGLAAMQLVNYFQRDGLNWDLSSEIRQMATFRKMNLIEPWPIMKRMDLVFLRNVLIYFSAENKKSILTKIHQIMAPHAILFLGAGESMINMDLPFQRCQIGQCVYYRPA